MASAIAIVSCSLAALLVASAALKLSHRPAVVASYARVGVKERQLGVLAALLILGALGLIAGLFWPALGVAASGALSIYFALAIAAHVRAGDARNLTMPVVLEIWSALALGLRVVELG